MFAYIASLTGSLSQKVFKDFIYLLLERGEGGERNTDVQEIGCLLHAPIWGPGLQPRYVPRLGIELAFL